MREKANTNPAYLASQLPSFGVDPCLIPALDDNRHKIVDILESIRKRSNLVITAASSGSPEDGAFHEAIDDGRSRQGFIRDCHDGNVRKNQRALISALLMLRKILLQEGLCT